MSTGTLTLTDLLDAARRDRRDLRLSAFRPGQVRGAVTAGLGPWLRRCTAEDNDAPASPLWPLVHGADLTARVLVAEQMDAVEEIVDRCAEVAPPLTLLKGVSLCEQIYPEPHLRTMGDTDLLVEEEALPAVQSRLMELGYQPRSHYPPEFYASHHHATPVFHPQRRIWVEVHRGLIPRTSPAGADRVFDSKTVLAERHDSLFRGRPVRRLNDELQLLYLASHWAFDFKLDRAVVGLLDVSRLLDQASLRWDRVLGWLEGSFASTYVCLLVTYLVRHRLADVDPAVLRALYDRQRSFGWANLRALHAAIERHVVEGRELGGIMSDRTFGIVWGTLLSPGRPWENLLALGWNLLPSRGWVLRRLRRNA